MNKLCPACVHHDDCDGIDKPKQCIKAKSAEQPDDCRKAFQEWISTGLIQESHKQILWMGWEAAWVSRKPERELSEPPKEMGMRMQDIKVGMVLRSIYGGLDVTVTEMTEKGFKYEHPRYIAGARIGYTDGGEHYGYNGYSHYTEIEVGK